MGAVSKLAEKEFSGLLDVTDEVQSIGTTVSRVFRNDPDRVFYQITNMSGGNMYVNFNANPSSSNGILLTPNGGTLSYSGKDDFTLVTKELYIIANIAASGLLVVAMRMDSSLPRGGN